ncbi:hypothetical protein LP419_22885 [Massilia sp. H-1]|nr:hypothetical protein LP419_22885 [Massilia sp. H-1]
MMTALPKVDTEFPGAYCLLCMVAASATNSTLTAYTRTLPYEELPQLKDQLGAVLSKRGATVTMIDKVDFEALPDYALKPRLTSRARISPRSRPSTRSTSWW